MKLILHTVFFLTCTTFCFAQHSLKIQVSYALPLQGYITSNQNVQILSEPYIDEGFSTLTQSSGVYNSFGSGFQFEVGYLRTLSGQFDVGMDVNLLIGKVIQETTVTSFDYKPNIQTSVTSMNINSIQFAPMIRFRFKAEKITPYVGMGPLISTGIFETQQGNTSTSETYRVALGLKNVFGLMYKKNSISSYFEIGIVGLTIEPTDVNDSDPIRPSMISRPMSNLSFNVGVMFPLLSSKSKVIEN